MKLLILAFLLIAAPFVFAEVSDEPGDHESPHTGNIIFESDKNPSIFEEAGLFQTFDSPEWATFFGVKPSKGYLDASINYYVRPGRLNVRDAGDISGEALGALSRNDLVRLKTGKVEGAFVELESFETHEKIKKSKTGRYYVAYDYLELKKTEGKKYGPSKYFIIQNIATEKMRVYEKMCDDGRCAHKMIFETDIVVGDVDKDKTVAGYYHITSWHKFYQDGAGSYPSWYDPNYPPMPSPNEGVSAWAENLPYKGASVRGAFGWYTAKVGPNSHYQWTHGTIGWGENKQEFIEATRGWWANLFLDPRSAGCSRTDNESIAYLRHLVDVGTPLIKVYVKEAYADPTLRNYSDRKDEWQYVLTKNGVRVDGQKADRQEVLNAGTPRHRWLEEGVFKVDRYPTAKPFLSGSMGAKASTNGNVYSLKHKHMKGVLLIDEGRLVGYKKPAKIGRGGYSNQQAPAFVIAPRSTNFTMPKCPVENGWDDDEYDFGQGGSSNSRCSEKKPL